MRIIVIMKKIKDPRGRPQNKKQREIIVNLRDNESMSFTKISKIFGISRQAVHQMYHRTREDTLWKEHANGVVRNLPEGQTNSYGNSNEENIAANHVHVIVT